MGHFKWFREARSYRNRQQHQQKENLNIKFNNNAKSELIALLNTIPASEMEIIRRKQATPNGLTKIVTIQLPSCLLWLNQYLTNKMQRFRALEYQFRIFRIANGLSGNVKYENAVLVLHLIWYRWNCIVMWLLKNVCIWFSFFLFKSHQILARTITDAIISIEFLAFFHPNKLSYAWVCSYF